MDSGIGYRQWGVPEPKAVLLLVHGLGAHSGRWEAMGEFFQRNNISSYAIECPSYEDFDGAILRVHDVILKQNPSKKIFLAGESLGGLVSFGLACRHPDLFAGLICLSPAFKSRLCLPAADYFKMATSMLFDPGRELKLPFDSSMCTRDSEYIRKMELDGRERRASSARSLARTLAAQALAPLLAGKLVTPVLFLIAGDDKLVDGAAAAGILKRVKTGDRSLIEYPQMYHSLSIDIGKEKVFADMLSWIGKRI